MSIFSAKKKYNITKSSSSSSSATGDHEHEYQSKYCSNSHEEGKCNKSTVESLYKSLAKGDADAVARLLAGDLEWWFHGPPDCQHMMRVLTGQLASNKFPFKPRTVSTIGEGTGWVVAEGWKGAHSYWVHVWTVKNGIITQFREYFNTLLTVTDLKIRNNNNNNIINITTATTTSTTCASATTLWQSQLPLRYNITSASPDSMPALLLAV